MRLWAICNIWSSKLVAKRGAKKKASSYKSLGALYSLKFMARPERFELPAFWFVARRSIQLS